MKGSMDRVQRGGPWSGSTGVVHGPGVHVLYTSLSRQVRKNLPSGIRKGYSRKRLGKCAGERFTHENLVYTQLFLDYLFLGHFLKTYSNTLQTSNVWLPNISCLHPIRTCFSVTCPRLDENDGTWKRVAGIFRYM